MSSQSDLLGKQRARKHFGDINALYVRKHGRSLTLALELYQCTMIYKIVSVENKLRTRKTLDEIGQGAWIGADS